jgi:hypothetical protein
MDDRLFFILGVRDGPLHVVDLYLGFRLHAVVLFFVLRVVHLEDFFLTVGRWRWRHWRRRRRGRGGGGRRLIMA